VVSYPYPCPDHGPDPGATAADPATARLIYVPVMHSSAEMGSAASAYQAAFVARFGKRKWQERCAEFDAIWAAITAAIDALGLDPATLKLYQDSLPVCGKEVALTRELAALGSHNHRLLAALIDKGATLVGTESPELLLEEYRLLQSAQRAPDEAAALLHKRDRFIAERIGASLAAGETGLLFMGALHQVARLLPPRIRVEYLAVRTR
jgi:hypothetical protein